LFWLTACILWKAAVFFFPGEISLFIDKEIGIFLEVFLIILVQIQFIFLFFGVKFCQIFNMKKKKKHWKAGFLLRIDN
jgi:hypothetical protein